MDHPELGDELNDLHPDSLKDQQWSVGISLETYERLYRLARLHLKEKGGDIVLDAEIEAAAIALCSADGDNWEEFDEEHRSTCRSQARAALVAAKRARVSV